MSDTIALRNTTASSANAVAPLIQFSVLMVCVVCFILVLFVGAAPSSVPETPSVAPQIGVLAPEAVVPERSLVEKTADALTPRMLAALDEIRRRYSMSAESLLPVFEIVERVGRERRIDPLLIVAIISIESGFNPFAESPMGAQGLMQVIPRFHVDKLPKGEARPLFNPATNIRVGTRVLEEAIRRRGGLVPGLQYYAGSSDLSGAYASKVLAEKERLEKAARRPSPASDA